MKTPWICLCSPEYRPLYERHFLPSFEAVRGDIDFNLHVLPLPNTSAGWATPDWNRHRLTALKTVRALMGMFKQAYDNRMVVSGVDFRFYEMPLFSERQRNCAILAAEDRAGVVCSDVIFVRLDKITFRFFDAWISVCELGGYSDDQIALNAVKSMMNSDDFGILPETYWTAGLRGLTRCPWEPGDFVPEPPEGIIMHHANFTVGVANKLALLDAVKAKIDARNGGNAP